MVKFNAVVISFKLSGIPSHYQVDQPLYDVSFSKLRAGGFLQYVKNKINEYVRSPDPKVYYELESPQSDVLHRVVVAFNSSVSLSRNILDFIGDEIRSHLIINASRYGIDTKKFSYYVYCYTIPFDYQQKEGETSLKVHLNPGDQYSVDIYLEKKLSPEEVAEAKKELTNKLPQRIPDKLIEITYNPDENCFSVVFEATSSMVIDRRVLSPSETHILKDIKSFQDLTIGEPTFIGGGPVLIPALKLITVIASIILGIGIITYLTIRFIAINPKAKDVFDKITGTVSLVAIAVIVGALAVILVPLLGGGERG